MTQRETTNCPLGRLHHLTPQLGTWGMQGSLGTLGGHVGLEDGRQEEPHGAQHTHNHEHPQEQPIDHHGHVLPVLHNLWADRGGSHRSVLGSPCSLPVPQVGPSLSGWNPTGPCASQLVSLPLPTPAASQSHGEPGLDRKLRCVIKNQT